MVCELSVLLWIECMRKLLYVVSDVVLVMVYVLLLNVVKVFV